MQKEDEMQMETSNPGVLHMNHIITLKGLVGKLSKDAGNNVLSGYYRAKDKNDCTQVLCFYS